MSAVMTGGPIGELRTALDASFNAVFGVDESGLIIYVNEQAGTGFGYPPSELIGQPVELLLPAGLDSVPEQTCPGFVEPATARPVGFGTDARARRQDGTEFPVEVSLSTVDRSTGPWVFATVTDVSTRNVTQFGPTSGGAGGSADERRLSLFASIVDSSDDAIMSSTLDRGDHELEQSRGTVVWLYSRRGDR